MEESEMQLFVLWDALLPVLTDEWFQKYLTQQILKCFKLLWYQLQATEKPIFSQSSKKDLGMEETDRQ